jgi:thiol peroxidase
MKGKQLTLMGMQLKVGDKAPDFEVAANDLSMVKFSSFRRKVNIITSVPSLDTSTCDKMTRQFNERAGKLGGDVLVAAISMDLPFAQKRWCAAAGIENVQTFSDYREADFGTKYGVLVKELKLLARSVFVIDEENTIRYIELVSELTHEPDYDAAIEASKGVVAHLY